MARVKSDIVWYVLAAVVGLVAMGAPSVASAAPSHDGSAASGVRTVRAHDGATHVVATKPGAAHGDQVTPAAGQSWHGCPYGAVCVYPANKGWNGDHPKYFFYSYAGHNIYNEYGTHRIADNQYGGHAAGLCAGSNGRGGFANESSGMVAEGSTVYYPIAWDQNLTPVNSLDLRPYSQFDSLCHR